MNEKPYDFVFVMSRFPYTLYPSGGENIIFQLCSRLKLDGYKVGIIVIKDHSRYLYSIKKDPKILSVSFSKHPQIRKLIFNTTFNKLFRAILRKANKIDYNFKILKGVDINFIEKPNEIKFKIKRIIATAWGTADFTSEYVNSNSSTTGYYFIQNSEDEPSYSGELNKHATETYNLKNLKKIVINKGLYKRFEGDNPLLFNVGIDYNEFYYDGPKKNIIMFPLRIGESKGAVYILNAISRLYAEVKDYQFIAFGDYPPDKVPKYIEFHHKATTSNLKKMFSESKIFVLPSLVEGFSLTVLEAMAAKCAVISTDCGGTNEYIIDKENALLTPIKDSISLEKSILKLSKNEELTKKLAENGQITVKNYSYDNMYIQFIKLFF